MFLHSYFNLLHPSDPFLMKLKNSITFFDAFFEGENFYWSHTCLALEDARFVRYLARRTFARIPKERGILGEFEILGDQGRSYLLRGYSVFRDIGGHRKTSHSTFLAQPRYSTPLAEGFIRHAYTRERSRSFVYMSSR